MTINNLADLFQMELQDIYDAEHQLVKALPKMAQAASSQELRSAFEQHLAQTQQQIQRLETVFKQLNQSAQRKTCEAMQGLVEEGQEILSIGEEARDAGLIAAAQKVEHYEIASYGCLVTWAQQLGHQESANLLKQTLGEEKATDEKLTVLAEAAVNVKAKKS